MFKNGISRRKQLKLLTELTEITTDKKYQLSAPAESVNFHYQILSSISMLRF